MRRSVKFMVGGCALVTALAGLALWQSADSSAEAPPGGQWRQPEPRNVEQPLLLRGTLLPVASVNISAPVDGTLVDRLVQFGDRVVAGQPVALVASPDMNGLLRDAEVAAIRAEEELAGAQLINESAEYQAAQRRAVQADVALTSAKRRAAETQTLYDKGIVARAELEGAQNDVQATEAQVQGSQDELAALRKKRSPRALRILQLEAQSRREKLAELRAKQAALRIVAPIAGVVLYPIASEGTDSASTSLKEIKPGSALTTRDVILSIGDTTSFVIKTWVDEHDLQLLEPHQPATIVLSSHPSRELAGQVLRISSQARAPENRGGATSAPEIEVQIALRTPTDLTLRVGAAAKVRVVPKPVAVGVLVPLAALQWSADGKPLLRVRTGRGEGNARPIEVARTTVDAVEVRSGLQAGDEVWVPDATARSVSPGGLLQRLLNTDD